MQKVPTKYCIIGLGMFFRNCGDERGHLPPIFPSGIPVKALRSSSLLPSLRHCSRPLDGVTLHVNWEF